MLLNLDGGEHDDEPEELYALADVVHVACGGHAGDATSMARVIASCLKVGTRIGAHPSYVDREGFGRRALSVPPDELRDQIAAQCMDLQKEAEQAHVAIGSVKPHGALYHAAHSDPRIARACVDGVRRAFGKKEMIIVGLADGELERVAKAEGYLFMREAFADRGVNNDGTLIPRGSPGALIEDPIVAAERGRILMKSPFVDTLCIHADTPSSLAIARAVRAALSSSSP